MTGFDNGPKDGDFVRYIEALNATRASAALQANPSQSAAGPSPFGAPPTGAPSTVQAARRTGNIAPTSPLPRIPSTQARAIADAFLRADGTVGPRAWGSLAALAIGMVLLIAGVFAAAFNAVFFAAGAALLYWTVGHWIRRWKTGADLRFAGFGTRRP